MTIRIKRVYETSDAGDGRRILVDRLWPRGLSKENAKLSYWAREIAPSNALRQWYGHDPVKWPEFKSRYFAELDANPDGFAELRRQMGEGTVTFVFSSKESRLNNAFALKDYFGSRLNSAPPRSPPEV
jgi:uncharacterized protein YeaO (DUF488 family)